MPKLNPYQQSKEISKLQRQARKLGCWIDRYGDQGKLDPKLDRGPYFLKHAGLKYLVWVHGLPLIGIADALNCYEQELRKGKVGEAWANFGEGWA